MDKTRISWSNKTLLSIWPAEGQGERQSNILAKYKESEILITFKLCYFDKEIQSASRKPRGACLVHRLLHAWFSKGGNKILQTTRRLCVEKNI